MALQVQLCKDNLPLLLLNTMFLLPNRQRHTGMDAVKSLPQNTQIIIA